MLAQALGSVLRTPMADIIPLMFNAGLTEALAEALQVLRSYASCLHSLRNTNHNKHRRSHVRL